MKDYKKNDNSESVWDNVIFLIKSILSFCVIALVIYLFAISFWKTLEDLLFLALIMAFFELLIMSGEGVLSWFSEE